MSIVLQNWNGSEIAFTANEIQMGRYTIPMGYVNATQMCKANGKRWADYKRLKATIEYWQELEDDTQIPTSLLVIEIEGYGSDQNSWVHQEIAIDLGAWISPKFRVWINRQIKNLMTEGIVTIKQMSPAEMLVAQAQEILAHERRIQKIEQESLVLKQQQDHHSKWLVGIDAELDRLESPEGHYFTIIGYAKLNNLTVGKELAKKLGRTASAYCRQNGLRKETVYDSMFGEVGNYPPDSLEHAFKKHNLI